MREVLAAGYSIGTTGTNNIAEAIALIIGADKVINLARERHGGIGDDREPNITALLDS